MSDQKIKKFKLKKFIKKLEKKRKRILNSIANQRKCAGYAGCDIIARKNVVDEILEELYKYIPKDKTNEGFKENTTYTF